MIAETLTLRFENEEMQRRFHERLNEPETYGDDAVAVKQFQSLMAGIVESAVLAERERCAKIAEGFLSKPGVTVSCACDVQIAAAIRKRE